MAGGFRLNTGEHIDERRLAGLYGTAVLLHAVVDPIVTYYTTVIMPVGYETNPFLRWAILDGLLTFIVVHLLLIVLAGVGFVSLLYLIRRADPPTDRRLAYALTIGCGGLILWGGAIVVWNLTLLMR